MKKIFDPFFTTKSGQGAQDLDLLQPTVSYVTITD